MRQIVININLIVDFKGPDVDDSVEYHIGCLYHTLWLFHFYLIGYAFCLR